MAVLLEINRLTNCEMIFHTFRLRANKCWTSLQIGRCKNLEPYYQPADMALDTHVTALVPKEKMSMYTMLFISECLSKLHGFFGHGLSISNPRAEKIRIMLPVSENGEPDYQFMEDYIRELMDRKYKQYKIYAQKMMAVLEEKSYVNQWGGGTPC